MVATLRGDSLVARDAGRLKGSRGPPAAPGDSHALYGTMRRDRWRPIPGRDRAPGRSKAAAGARPRLFHRYWICGESQQRRAGCCTCAATRVSRDADRRAALVVVNETVIHASPSLHGGAGMRRHHSAATVVRQALSRGRAVLCTGLELPEAHTHAISQDDNASALVTFQRGA